MTSDDTDSIPDVVQLRTFDLVFYVISVVSYIADIVSDVIVAYTHYTENRVSIIFKKSKKIVIKFYETSAKLVTITG